MLQRLKSLFGAPRPAGPSRPIRTFDGSESTINTDCVVQCGRGWLIDVDEARTIRLFEVETAELEQCMVTYRARLKSENVRGRGYLEMWCRIPGRGEFFSKGFHDTVQGSNDWSTYEIPFYLKRGQRPDLVKLNVTVEGPGKIWIEDIDLSYTPLE